MKPNLSDSWVILICGILYQVEMVQSRTTFKSSGKRTRTTATKGESTTTSVSLLDIPQNDIYNNELEENINRHSTRKSPYTLSEISRISWDTLLSNNKEKSSERNPTSGKIKIIRGPPGPRGPPGATMTKDYMAKEFKKMVKQAANKKARKIISEQCPTCNVNKDVDTDVLSFFYPGVQDKVRTVNRAPLAFTSKLLDKVTIFPNKLVTLKEFQLAGSKYGLARGVEADIGMDGKFTADKPGIYQFSVTLNFHSRHKVATEMKTNYVQVLLCPNGQCAQIDSKRSIIIPQYIHSMDSRQRFFTIQLTAMLELQKSDYISINVRNSCRRMIDVQAGSLVTGIMISV